MSVAKWSRRGRQALAEGAPEQALAAYRKALERDPRAEEPLAALCHLLNAMGRSEQALPYARVLHRHAYPPRAKRHAGMVLLKQECLEQAHACFVAARPLEHDDAPVVAYLNDTAMRLADWATAQRCQGYLAQRYAAGDFTARENPFRAIGWCPRDDWNRQLAQTYWRRRAPAGAAPPTLRQPVAGRPLRVGYLSGDWKEHATLQLMIGLFERHDPETVEVRVYCHSQADASPLRRRLERAVGRIVDLNPLSDAEAAARIRADCLDILVDCKGYTRGNRTPILGYRPAPIQVNFLAFPGSMGSDVHDYLIGDPHVTPPGCEAAFSEAICRLPDTYQPNDRRRAMAAPPTRSQAGLPSEGFVFCCFNQAYKLEPLRWQTFMAILRDVPGSVLWLLEPGAAVRNALCARAREQGVDPARLLFAPPCPNEEHLARLSLADLALDTRIYTGHTTTADALWAGVPVLATRGSHFASRVSQSLLCALDMADLLVSDEAAFHCRAVELATQPECLAQLRERVAQGRREAPLFDTVRYTRHLERAYRAMVERAAAGQSPASFDVAPGPHSSTADPAL